MTGINRITTQAIQSLPPYPGGGWFDGLKIQITSEEVRAILTQRIEKLETEIAKAESTIERTKKFAEQFNEDNPANEDEDIKLTRIVNNNQHTVDSSKATARTLAFIRDHTPENTVYIVKWDEYMSSWLMPE